MALHICGMTLTAGTIKVWFHTEQNYPMIQQRRNFLRHTVSFASTEVNLK